MDEKFIKSADISTDPPIPIQILVPERGFWQPGDFSIENDLVSHIIKKC